LFVCVCGYVFFWVSVLYCVFEFVWTLLFCVCVCVCMCICLYVCVRVRVRVRVGVRVWVYLYVHMRVSSYFSKILPVSAHAYLPVIESLRFLGCQDGVCSCQMQGGNVWQAHRHTYTYTHTHAHAHTHTWLHFLNIKTHKHNL